MERDILRSARNVYERFVAERYWAYSVSKMKLQATVLFVIDDQRDTNFLVYLFVPNQLYMFRAVFSPIIRST